MWQEGGRPLSDYPGPVSTVSSEWTSPVTGLDISVHAQSGQQARGRPRSGVGAALLSGRNSYTILVIIMGVEDEEGGVNYEA